MTLLAASPEAEAHHCDWRELVRVVEARGGADALIVDAPYSERTHDGHMDSAAMANKASYAERHQTAIGRYASVDRRRTINYDAWAAADVADFCAAWAPHVRGWFVSLTDHVLAPAWLSALEAIGLCVFSPLACVEPGSRVRMSGDGPAQWSCWAVAARPRGEPYSKWGALPGAYVVPAGGRGEWRGAYGGVRVVGGKPLWLMERLVEDYSRPGDLIVDPCAGAFTTGQAAIRTGRRFIGGDALAEHAEIGRRWVEAPKQRALFGGAA